MVKMLKIDQIISMLFEFELKFRRLLFELECLVWVLVFWFFFDTVFRVTCEP